MLTFTDIPMKCCNLGSPNVIPDIKYGFAGGNPLPAITDTGMTPEEGAWVRQGDIHTMLPYTMQDGYDRNLTDSSLRCAVLENEYLRAEFALDLGGRLWSLYDKKHDRELLFRNNVFQAANLALRNAWFSGGVEWNIGIIGHHPFTCSPLFSSSYKNEKGEDVLKMWEFERKRGLVYSVRATLAGDVLLVRVNIENPSDRPTYVYWWSNMAVEEHEGTRVIVPADSYYSYDRDSDGRYHSHNPKVPFDGYYPSRHDHSYDYFFRIPKESHKFEAAVEPDGNGFVQFSTPNLIGRKLFVWGTQAQGGRHWNRWLSHDGRYYAETQAGLLHSQYEQAPMAPGASFEWTEGYTGLYGDGGLFMSDDYREAMHYTDNILTLGGRFYLVENADAFFAADGDEKLNSCGSGWGALVELYTGRKLSSLASFPAESIAENTPEHDFLDLYEKGALPERPAGLYEDYPIDYVGGAYGGEFLNKLENAPETWYSWLELGCFYYEAKSFNAAEAAFRKSVRLTPNAPAYTALAKISIAHGEKEKAKDYIKKALDVPGEYVRLVIDALNFMKAYGTPEESEAVVSKAVSAHPSYLSNGRIAILWAQILIKQNRLDEAEQIVRNTPAAADIREGEVTTTQVWLDLYRAIIARDEKRDAASIEPKEVFERYPVPEEIDFRMS